MRLARRCYQNLVVWGWWALSLMTVEALAGGGAENVFLLIDPQSDASKYVGNYYKQARNIPDRNVIYLQAVPTTGNYEDFTETTLPVFLGMLSHRGVSDHIDYAVIPPGGAYRLSAAGHISDGCSPVNNFSASSLYTMARLADIILIGSSSSATNQYYSSDDTAIAFDSNIEWFSGDPSTSPSARSYFIGHMLGYDGNRGNTVEETLAMIDRSVAVDGTRPAGTFYYMKTNDELRSAPRDFAFPAAIASLTGLGADAVQINDWLPTGKDDCLGIMSGFASVDILAEDMTILPGAFGDHLTSYAGFFDEGDQTKMSEWITKGTSGTCGTVEEPCNYPGKFPHARMHVFYYQGLSLGESVLRSLQYVPYQVLMYGDPLTRPFAYLPMVTVADAPTKPVSGTITLTPSATTANPDADIAGFDLLVDGVLADSIFVGEDFSIDTTAWTDGFHDVRIIAYEDSDIATQGRWTQSIETANHGRSITVSATPTTGDLDTLFDIDVSASSEAELFEVRLRQNGRVVAAASTSSESFPVFGKIFGAGTVTLVAEAEFDDGTRAISEPFTLDIADSSSGFGNPRGVAPAIAYSYHLDVPVNEPMVIDLPGTNPEAPDMTWTVIGLPAQATVVGTAGPTRFLFPDELAQGTDTLTFYVNQGTNQSNLGTVTLRYQDCLPPGIETQPVDNTACDGGSATFTVESLDGVSYQWYFEDAAIIGATSNVLFISPVTFASAGDYHVDVLSACGSSVSSQTATLTVVGVFPKFVVQPTNATVACGGLAFFVATATGDVPPTYQWQHNDVNIPGAIASILILPAVDADDAGEYRALATNQCGTKFSNEATLTVTGCAAPPNIVSAAAVADHGSVGDLAIALTLTGVTTESRLESPESLSVVFDQAMNEAVAEDTDNISIVGVNNGSIDSSDLSAVLTGGTTLTITFPGLLGAALPSGDLYTVDLSLLKSVTGELVGGGADPDFQIRVLAADTNGDSVVDPLDSGAVLARFGDDVTLETRSDINTDGAIDPLDVGAVLARFGNTAP